MKSKVWKNIKGKRDQKKRNNKNNNTKMSYLITSEEDSFAMTLLIITLLKMTKINYDGLALLYDR